MSSDTLAKSAAVPETPDGADLPRIVPHHRPGPPGIGQYCVQTHRAGGTECSR
ncbi:hypothetical protein [Streptomyces sp. NPDC060275]|uniref:hypothetical protein n=1 Tax=Streptomyces sp. NPDC060275 TaxID=3347090 RepID=UPI003646D2C9